MLFLVDSGALLEVLATSAHDAVDLALLPAFGETQPKKQPTGAISVYRLLCAREIRRSEGESFDELYTGSLLQEAVFAAPESCASASEEPAA